MNDEFQVEEIDPIEHGLETLKSFVVLGVKDFDADRSSNAESISEEAKAAGASGRRQSDDSDGSSDRVDASNHASPRSVSSTRGLHTQQVNAHALPHSPKVATRRLHSPMRAYTNSGLVSSAKQSFNGTVEREAQTPVGALVSPATYSSSYIVATAFTPSALSDASHQTGDLVELTHAFPISFVNQSNAPSAASIEQRSASLDQLLNSHTVSWESFTQQV